MKATTPDEVDALIQALAKDTDERQTRLSRAQQELGRSEQSWRQSAEAAAATTADDAKKALNRDRKSIEANVDELRTSALSIVRGAIDRRAPSYLSADWTDGIWSAQPVPDRGEWIRVGTLTLGSEELPVALPLSSGVWNVVSPSPDALRTFVQNIIARTVAAFDPQHVKVLTYDPSLSLDVAVFAGVRTLSPSSVPPAITSEEEFEQTLDALRIELSAIDDRLTAAGQHSFWIVAAEGHPLAASTPFRLLIVGSKPSLLSDRGTARLEQIRQLAADRGLLVVESVDSELPAASHPAVTVTLGSNSATTSVMPGTRWTPDPWAGDAFIRNMCSSLAKRQRKSLAPTVDFEDIIERITDPWMSGADEGVEAVIGTIDGGDLVLRLRSENPPMPNALIGGAVGQGKSNLLQVLIYSLAARYSPAELEMVLVDLRDGVEFASLGPSTASPTWLPHIRALGLEFDPDYSLAVLRWVRRQMAERSKHLKASEVTTLKQYHKRTGKRLPRLLVVIDEFQRLFEGDDDQAATVAMELDDIARTGRGFGIHLVLASQAITGIRGLATKSESIFGQFHNRVVLKNTPAESQAFLTAHNLAAVDLDYRGQAVFNDALGAIERNRLGTVAFAKPDYLSQLQVNLYQRGHGAEPSIFRASAFAEWSPREAESESSNGVDAAIGMPVEVAARPRTIALGLSPNQAVAVVGSTREIAIPILVRSVASAARSIGADARLTVLDGDSLGDATNAWVEALIGYLAKYCAEVVRVPREDVAAKLIELSREMEQTDMVVAIALDSVDLGTPVGPNYEMPNDSLRELLKNGPLAKTWTIGWWQSKAVLEDHLGYRAPGVRGWAFAGVSRDDLTDIAGHAVREPSTSPRFVWFDRTAGTDAERLVPFSPHDIIGAVDIAQR